MENFEVSQGKSLKLGTTMERNATTFTKKGNKSMSAEDVQTIVDGINSRIESDSKFIYRYVITARTPLNKFFTIKGYKDKYANYEEMDDYLAGRVKDTTKFEEIYSVTITMIKEKRPKK
jgi:hypothetical protein